ncbi:MAG: YceI family protein [Bacteroidetes bacterium]|nr:YceI family protein [Bacteroidota bacterium]
MKSMVILVLFLAFGSVQAQIYSIKNGIAKFTTSAETMGIDSQFEGVGAGLDGTLNLKDSTFRFTFELKKLKTGIKLRDTHMHEDYLETDSYPTATFNGKIKPNGRPGAVIAVGVFTVHGVSKPVTATGFIAENRLKARWMIRLTDYNIEIPEKFIINKVKETLSMSIDVEIKEK